MALDIFVRRFGRFCSRPNERRPGKSGERAGWKARPEKARTTVTGATDLKTTLELNTAILEIIKPACSSGLIGWGQSKMTAPEQCVLERGL